MLMRGLELRGLLCVAQARATNERERELEPMPWVPLPVFSEVHILKGFKSFVLEVRIRQGLQARFAEVQILKDLEANITLAEIPRFRGILAARLTAWLAFLWREAKEPRGSALR
jgi:hypothetical protein